MSEPFLPDDPSPAAVRVQQSQRTKISTALSGKIQTRLWGSQSYKLGLSYNPMRRDQAGPLIAFLHEMQGRHGIFRMKLPQLTAESGVAVGNFVNFLGDSKLHMVIADDPLVTMPEPREGGTTVDPAGPYIRCSLDSDVQEISLGRNGLIQLSFNVIERL